MNLNNLIVVDEGVEYQSHMLNAEKDAKDIKKAIQFEQNYFGVHVFAVAIHENYDLNKKIEISTNNLGTCLTPEVQDTVNDVCYLEGMDIFEVGQIPVSYRLIIDECDWDSHVPLPLSVIKRYLNKNQKNNLSNWIDGFKSKNCSIKFVQFLGIC